MSLFGTDGIRGVANEDLTPDLALAVGRAAARVLAPSGGTILVGRDTRTSGPMLQAALVAGLCSGRCNVALAGVIPTPAVAFLTIDEKANGGAVISASHNPVRDNGIKFFSGEGLKTSGDTEAAIEAALARPDPPPPEIGVVEDLRDASGRYVDHLLGSITRPLAGVRVVLDCAFGAAYSVAPRAFRAAGADVVAINAEPEGARINVDCGSTSLEGVAKKVVEVSADLGLAFDGDADRVLAVDETGSPVDGDHILALCALDMHRRGELTNEVVISTVMANLGFTRHLEGRGIIVVAAPVGDKFVAEEMAANGAVLGGEQSGHIIFGKYSTTGDGILTGLKIAESLVASDARFSELVRIFDPYPQVLINVPDVDRSRLESSSELWDEMHAVEAELGPRGRVLLRPSGTEPVVRVMVEADDDDIARAQAARLVDAVTKYLR